MNINRISNTIKDTSRSIYIQLVAGKMHDTKPLSKDIKELENALVALKAILTLEATGYMTDIEPTCNDSDLRGLAARESQI